jgi:hypothetical protein
MISNDNHILRGSRKIGEAVFTPSKSEIAVILPVPSSAWYLKNRLLLLFRLVYRQVITSRQVNGLGQSCAGFRLGSCSRRTVEQTEISGILTAHSYNMCGKVVSQSNKINSLSGLDQWKCAVRFGFGRDRGSWSGGTPLEKYRSTSAAPPPLHSINCSYFTRVFYRQSRYLILGCFGRFRKVGGAGGANLFQNFETIGYPNA